MNSNQGYVWFILIRFNPMGYTATGGKFKHQDKTEPQHDHKKKIYTHRTNRKHATTCGPQYNIHSSGVMTALLGPEGLA